MLGVTGDVGGKEFITLERIVIRSDSESFTVWQLRQHQKMLSATHKSEPVALAECPSDSQY